VARGVRIGVDVGTVRVGVAASDPDGIMAPARIAAIVEERGAIEVYVGLPRHLSGAEGVSAADARAFAGLVAERVETPVRLIDERLSTTTASRAMREAGRNAKSQRSDIDQAAAVVILDTVLDAAKRGNLGKVATTVAREENHD